MPIDYGSLISLYNDGFLEAYKKVVDDVNLPREIHSRIIDSFTNLLNSLNSTEEADTISHLSTSHHNLFKATNICYIYLNSLTRSDVDEICKNPKNIQKYSKIPSKDFIAKVAAFKKASDESKEITLKNKDATKKEQLAAIKREAQLAIDLRDNIDLEKYKNRTMKPIRYIRSNKSLLKNSGVGAFGLYITFETIKYIWPSILVDATWVWNNTTNNLSILGH